MIFDAQALLKSKIYSRVESSGWPITPKVRWPISPHHPLRYSDKLNAYRSPSPSNLVQNHRQSLQSQSKGPTGSVGDARVANDFLLDDAAAQNFHPFAAEENFHLPARVGKWEICIHPPVKFACSRGKLFSYLWRKLGEEERKSRKKWVRVCGGRRVKGGD